MLPGVIGSTQNDCPLGSIAWLIQELCSSNDVASHFTRMPQCLYQCLSLFSMKEQTLFILFRCTALRWQSHDSHHYFQRSTVKDPLFSIAHHAVNFSWLKGDWVCLWDCWDAQRLMFFLLACPIRWKWASSLNRIKPRSPVLFSIPSLVVWQNSLLSYWHQFVFGGFALCTETTLSHCEWLFACSFLKCQLPETVVMSVFMVIVQDAPLWPEH